jgi:hypothetical protein
MRPGWMQFTVIFVVHLVFSFSKWLSWTLFAGDLILIGYLAFRAYRDGKHSFHSIERFDPSAKPVVSAETLDRCEVPFFGPLASSILDGE